MKKGKKVGRRRNESIRLDPQQEDDFMEWIKDNEEFHSTKRDSRSKSVVSKKAMLEPLAVRFKCSSKLKSFEIYTVILISIYIFIYIYIYIYRWISNSLLKGKFFL